ncbi:hypothetical protein SDC9_128030 [bioreactor metagenome]|uniref:Uncharacterized protein n=1 Tax=bioreactor metagenome TaxID=1076179 RepID=A0A645CVQ0_9ZZZZ
MTAPQACAAVPADGINLINEYDAGGATLGLFKQIPYTACAYADKHLNKVRTADGEERNLGFTRNSLGKQGLAGTGRADKQHTLGDPGPKLKVFFGLL